MIDGKGLYQIPPEQWKELFHVQGQAIYDELQKGKFGRLCFPAFIGPLSTRLAKSLRVWSFSSEQSNDSDEKSSENLQSSSPVLPSRQQSVVCFKFIINNLRFPERHKVRISGPSKAGWPWGNFGAINLNRGIHLLGSTQIMRNQTLQNITIKAAIPARLPKITQSFTVIMRKPLGLHWTILG